MWDRTLFIMCGDWNRNLLWQKYSVKCQDLVSQVFSKIRSAFLDILIPLELTRDLQ